jgi:Signal peptidase, peptidase S26
MGVALAFLASFFVAVAMTGWVANDARARGRRWIAWGIASGLFGVFGLIAWLVSRRRAPVIGANTGRTPAAAIYAAAFCLILLEGTTALAIRTFGYQLARVEGQAMASTIQDDDRLLVEKWRYLSTAPRRGEIVMLLYPRFQRSEVLISSVGCFGEVSP